MIKTLRALLAVALLLAQPALAAPVTIALPDKADTVIVPEGSGLKFVKFDEEHQAIFNGKLTLTGTYYYGHNEYDDEGNFFTLYFRPDAASAARMPYLKTRGKPADMVLTSEALFLKTYLPKDTMAHVRPGRDTYASGAITVTVDTVSAGVVCDGPSWTARFVSAAKPVPVKFGKMPDSGC
jgi:hypothetical protein